MEIEHKSVNKLLLDSNNARFKELYSGSRDEEDLIDYLIYNEAAKEIAINISRRGFYPDKALLVLKKGKKFLVKDGNRRLAAVKALIFPKRFGLNIKKKEINTLPIVVYSNEKELDRRITEEHANNLFREWERIVKALKVFDMKKEGSSEEDMREVGPDFSALLKLANFYFKAVRISGENLKRLLRRSKKEGGGKTIIFERLFRYSLLCGYSFEGPSYKIKITNRNKFKSYVESLVSYLEDNPTTKHQDIDDKKEKFLDELKPYGFSPLKKTGREKEKIRKKRGTIKNKPLFKRKKIPLKLKKLIDECYGLDNEKNPNAKVALSRIVFEATLKYIIEKTQYNSKYLNSYNHFQRAFYNKKGNKLPYTDFSKLKEKFTELIKDRNIQQTFREFDLEKLNQRIHNYQIGASPGDAETAGGNLIPLIEFMLQDIGDFLDSIDTQKLR